jgi:predicted ATPase/class 3 adenylate cyclase
VVVSPEQREQGPGQPSGVVTLLFTDIEGSTKLLRALSAEDSLAAFALHGAVLREVFRRYRGYEQRTEGDSFFLVFQDAGDAVAAAVEAQRALTVQAWPGGLPVRVRMGLHTGEPTPVAGDYVGLDVHRAARIAAAGHGGQVLLSRATRASAAMPSGVGLRDLGEHRLKDLARPEWIFQLEIDGLERDFPPLNSLETPSNLPSAVTPLVGRDADVAVVEGLLGTVGVRMVTITGPGGSGKTRLALAAAWRLGEVFRNGLVFVDLTTVTDPTKVGAAIELALDLPSIPDVEAIENVATQLRDRAVLLVLDNFEHVPTAAGDLARLLAGTRRVKTIVTSRTALRIAAERECPLPPLAAEAAIALFVDRARAVRPAFDPTGAEAGAVREICARLDHLPLAIELAAAGVRLLSVEQIRHRLDSRLGLLEGVRRDVPARQRTLHDTIAWSYDLLPAEASELLCHVAVFVGGFTLEAVERVSPGDTDTFAGVGTLVDQNLLRHDVDAGRFSMLETIREFALDEARSRGLFTEASRRHAAFFAELGEQTEAGLRAADTAVRVRLDDELPNLRAALLWALESEPPHGELAARLAITLGQHWYTHGRAVEGAACLRRVHALEGVPLGLRARVAQRLGVLLDQQADKAGAAEVLTEALELFRQAGDRAGEARALNSLGSASRTVGSTTRARELYDEALRIRVEIGDRAGISVTTFNLGQLAMDDGDHDTARRLFELSHDLDTSLGDDWGAMIGSLGIAAAAVAQGDLDAAPPRLADAVRFFLAAEDEDHLSEALSVCAAEACARQQFERSARLLGAVEGLWAGLGFSLSPVDDVYVETCRSAVRAAMSPEAFAAAHAEGRAMTPAQAVAFAVDGLAPHPATLGSGTRP